MPENMLHSGKKLLKTYYNKMIIHNEELKTLLEEKGKLVEAGRAISQALELVGREITDKELLAKGVTIDGDIYSGSFGLMKAAFSYTTQNTISELIKAQCGEQLEEIEAKTLQLTQMNEKVNEIVKGLLPELNLGEYEYPTNIELVGIDVDLTIANALEEFKAKYLAKNEVQR